MRDELIVWKLVHEKIVTLKELVEDYTIEDVHKLLAFHEYSNYLEVKIRKHFENEHKNKLGKK